MKPVADQSLYELLEVPSDAPTVEIRRAWERMHALYAPGSLATYTLMAPDEAALVGARLEEARTVLLDPVAREQYDARLSGTPAPRPGRTSPTAPEARGGAAARARPPAIVLSKVVEPPAPIPLLATVAAEPAAPPPPPPAAPAPPPRVERELYVAEGTRYSGELLRRARETRGLTVAQLAERTRITRHHIENIEADRHDQLPAPVYLRGILMALARELRLDGQKVARGYLEAAARPRGEGDGER